MKKKKRKYSEEMQTTQSAIMHINQENKKDRAKSWHSALYLWTSWATSSGLGCGVRRVRLSIASPSGENELRIRVRTMQLIGSIVLLQLRAEKWVQATTASQVAFFWDFECCDPSRNVTVKCNYSYLNMSGEDDHFLSLFCLLYPPLMFDL